MRGMKDNEEIHRYLINFRLIPVSNVTNMTLMLKTATLNEASCLSKALLCVRREGRTWGAALATLSAGPSGDGCGLL